MMLGEQELKSILDSLLPEYDASSDRGPVLPREAAESVKQAQKQQHKTSCLSDVKPVPEWITESKEGLVKPSALF